MSSDADTLGWNTDHVKIRRRHHKRGRKRKTADGFTRSMSESSVVSKEFFVPEAGDRPLRRGRRLNTTDDENRLSSGSVEAMQRNTFASPTANYVSLAKKPAASYVNKNKECTDEEEQIDVLDPVEEYSEPECEASYYDSDLERHSLRQRNQPQPPEEFIFDSEG